MIISITHSPSAWMPLCFVSICLEYIAAVPISPFSPGVNSSGYLNIDIVIIQMIYLSSQTLNSSFHYLKKSIALILFYFFLVFLILLVLLVLLALLALLVLLVFIFLLALLVLLGCYCCCYLWMTILGECML